MSTTIIFDEVWGGHHLEYLHHLYTGYMKCPDNNYVFIVNRKLLDIKDRFEWPDCGNIRFDYIDVNINEDKSFMGKLKYSYRMSKLVRYYVKKYHANSVFFIFLISYIPFLPFFIPRNVSISGILYRVYLYDWNEYSVVEKVLEILRFSIMRFAKSIKNIYILNCKKSTADLNRIWFTSKFKYLPDPYIELDDEISAENIPSNKKILLHFGAMMKRKGTLEILDSLQYFAEKEKEQYCLVFAGKVGEEIKEEFYKKVKFYKDKVDIYVYDEFCSYNFISNIVKRSYCVLMPYYNTSQSSGLLGYAIQYEKPVILPAKGMLANISAETDNGVYVNTVKPKDIYMSILSVKNKIVDKDKCKDYINTHKICDFQKIICN